jgi:hypothetical protein
MLGNATVFGRISFLQMRASNSAVPAALISVAVPWSLVDIVYTGRESRYSVVLIMLSLENVRQIGGAESTRVIHVASGGGSRDDDHAS